MATDQKHEAGTSKPKSKPKLSKEERKRLMRSMTLAFREPKPKEG